VVAGVSAENGMEAYLMKPKSINSDSFIEFIEILLHNNDPRFIAIFMDNASIHHSKKVTKFCTLLGLQLIFNVPYCPQYNPIERVWSVIKNLYKRMKLKQISYKNPKKHELLVRNSMDSIIDKTVRSICLNTIHKEVLNKD
jgi:transposase